MPSYPISPYSIEGKKLRLLDVLSDTYARKELKMKEFLFLPDKLAHVHWKKKKMHAFGKRGYVTTVKKEIAS